MLVVCPETTLAYLDAEKKLKLRWVNPAIVGKMMNAASCVRSTVPNLTFFCSSFTLILNVSNLLETQRHMKRMKHSPNALVFNNVYVKNCKRAHIRNRAPKWIKHGERRYLKLGELR